MLYNAVQKKKEKKRLRDGKMNLSHEDKTSYM